MAVHFVYRSHYHGPTGLYVKHFEEPSILDWFLNRWRGVPYQPYESGAHEYAKGLLGTHVYGFGSLFDAVAQHSLAPPRSFGALRDLLEEHLYVEGELLCSPHLMQVLTDDDEIQLAYYFFDDEYLKKHWGRAAFLLHERWQMPADVGAGGYRPAEKTTQIGKVNGEGRTYLVFHDFWDSGNLDDIEGAFRIDGIRLPQLAQYLTWGELLLDGCPGYDVPALKAHLFPKGKKAKAPEDPFLFAIRADPEDDAPWMIFSDWLAERGRPSAGAFLLERALRGVSRSVPGDYSGWKFNPKKSLVQVEEHVAVFCRHVAQWEKGGPGMFHQWYFFDDLWAGAHPDLANAILRYAGRWDVL